MDKVPPPSTTITATKKEKRKKGCNIFVISQERRNNEADFLHPNKHQAFLQVKFWWTWPGMRKVS